MIKNVLLLIAGLSLSMSSCTEPETYSRYIIENNTPDTIYLALEDWGDGAQEDTLAPSIVRELAYISERGTVSSPAAADQLFSSLIVTNIDQDTLDEALNITHWTVLSIGDGKKKESWNHEVALVVDSVDFE